MAMDVETVRARVAGHRNWYHRIELRPGLVTPGTHDSQKALSALDGVGLPASCTGLRVLDIGCRDGFFAFEMERRGANVLAVDYAEPTLTGFSIAAEALGSRVDYRVLNVYDLDPERDGLFDLVLFLGVLYHMRNPVLALDRVRRVAAPGGLAFVETQICAEPGIADRDQPLWQFFPRDSLRGDATNKWAPNVAGLRAALEECQLQVLEVAAENDRAVVRTRAVWDKHLDYYRRLDSGTRIWGRGGRPRD
jgi:tRNA (mo5U34)-methyltransferase